MKEAGVWSMVVGVVIAIVALFLDTTYGDSYNTGLLQKQQNLLLIGLFFYLTGIILLCTGYILVAIEKPSGKKEKETVFDADKKAVKVGSYLICPKCNKSNPSDFKKCRYCNTELILDEMKQVEEISKADFSKGN